jgi:hypothetical protein
MEPGAHLCTSWKTDQNFAKSPDLTRMKEGTFLKGFRLKAALV